MELPETTIKELKDVLVVDIGEAVNEFTEDELNEFGIFLLTIGAISLKIKARRK